MLKVSSFAVCAQLFFFLAPSESRSQTSEVPVGKTNYSYNQTIGNSSSVSVGMTSSFGVSSSAQASPSYNAAGTATLVLNTQQTGASALPTNFSSQSVGTEANNSPVNIKITSESIQTKSTDGVTTQETIGSRQVTDANGYKDDSNNSSNAEFTAQGFGAKQDLRFLGNGDGTTPSGTKFTADVTPLLNTDEQGKTTAGSTYGSGTANANAESRTRFQSDITTSTFVNSFVSSF